MKVEKFKARIGKICYKKAPKKIYKYNYKKKNEEPQTEEGTYYYGACFLYEIMTGGRNQPWKASLELTEEEFNSRKFAKGDIIEVLKCTQKTSSTTFVVHDKKQLDGYYNSEDKRIYKSEKNGNTLVADEVITFVTLRIKSSDVKLLFKSNDDYVIIVDNIQLDLMPRQRYMQDIMFTFDDETIQNFTKYEDEIVQCQINGSIGKFARFKAIAHIDKNEDGTYLFTLVRQDKLPSIPKNQLDYWMVIAGYQFAILDTQEKRQFYTWELPTKELYQEFQQYDGLRLEVEEYSSVQLLKKQEALIELVILDNKFWLNLNFAIIDERPEIEIDYTFYKKNISKYDAVKGSYNNETRKIKVKERVNVKHETI